MYTKFSSEDIKTILTTNMQDWKVVGKNCLPTVIYANESLDEEDISVIVDPEFYDDLMEGKLSSEDVTDLHFIGYMGKFPLHILEILHNIYNK